MEDLLLNTVCAILAGCVCHDQAHAEETRGLLELLLRAVWARVKASLITGDGFEELEHDLLSVLQRMGGNSSE